MLVHGGRQQQDTCEAAQPKSCTGLQVNTIFFRPHQDEHFRIFLAGWCKANRAPEAICLKLSYCLHASLKLSSGRNVNRFIFGYLQITKRMHGLTFMRKWC